MRINNRELPEYGTVVGFIKLIRNASPSIPAIFTNGGCYQFACMLQAVFPNSRLMDDEDHVIVEIPVFGPKGVVHRYFDIWGEVQDPGHHRPMTAKDCEEMAYKQSVLNPHTMEWHARDRRDEEE